MAKYRAISVVQWFGCNHHTNIRRLAGGLTNSLSGQRGFLKLSGNSGGRSVSDQDRKMREAVAHMHSFHPILPGVALSISEDRSEYNIHPL